MDIALIVHQNDELALIQSALEDPEIYLL